MDPLCHRWFFSYEMPPQIKAMLTTNNRREKVIAFHLKSARATGTWAGLSGRLTVARAH